MEFNLSEKIELDHWHNPTGVPIKDVKEFIKLLKEEFKNRDYMNASGEIITINYIINKLAGDKLNGV